MDRALTQVVETHPTATWDEIAALVSEPGSFVVTGDMARNRAKRAGIRRPDVSPEKIKLVDHRNFIGIRTGFVDIEATDLGASWGHVLCCSFCDEWGDVKTFRLDDPKYAGDNLADDSRLVVAIRDEMEKYDVVVGHNFRLYDRAFLNARIMRKPKPDGTRERPISLLLKIVDTLFMAGGQNLRLGSRRLDNIARYFELDEQKTPLTGQTWQLAGAGVKEAMDLVVEHCEHDVRVERLAFEVFKPFLTIIHR